MHIKFITQVLSICIFLILIKAELRPSELEECRKIYIINSYHIDYSWTRDLTMAQINYIKKQYPQSEFMVEFLDLNRFTENIYLLWCNEIISFKVKKFKPEVIIVNDNGAYNFVIKFRKTLFKELPIVFAGLSGFENKIETIPAGITGVLENADTVGTVETILKFHPEIKTLYIIADQSLTVQYYKKDIVTHLNKYAAKFSYKFLDYMKIEDILTVS